MANAWEIFKRNRDAMNQRASKNEGFVENNAWEQFKRKKERKNEKIEYKDPSRVSVRGVTANKAVASKEDTWSPDEEYRWNQEEEYRAYIDALRMHGLSRDEYDRQNRGKNKEKSTSQIDDEQAYRQYVDAQKERERKDEITAGDERRMMELLERYANERTQPEIAADIEASRKKQQALEQEKRGYENERNALGKALGGRASAYSDMKDARALYADRSGAADRAGTRLWLEQHKEQQLQDEMYWNRYFAYEALQNNADFAEKSKYKPTATGEASKFSALAEQYDTSSAFADVYYDAINKNERALGMLDTNASLAQKLGGMDRTERQQMSDSEIATFNYIYAVDGADAAYRYVDFLSYELRSRQREQLQNYASKYAEQHPVVSSAFSVVANSMKGVGELAAIADFVTDGTMESDAGYNRASYMANSIRNQVSSKWGPVGSFAYQTGMSMADFLYNAAVTGGIVGLEGTAGQWASNAALAIMGSSAAADATLEAKDRGVSDSQAFSLGIIAGAAEIVTEKISLDTLLKVPKVKDEAVRYLMENIASEGAEEGLSDIINWTADVLISQNESEWRRSITAKQSEGYTEKQAFWRALADKALEIGLDTLGGAISGGIMAGVPVAGQKIQDQYWKNAEKKVDKQSARDAKAEQEAREDAQKEDAGIKGNEPWAQEMPQELLQEARDRGYGTAEAVVLDSAYKDHAKHEKNPLSQKEYAKRFDAAYIYGKTGTSLTATYGKKEVRGLTRPTIKAAHELGVKAYQAAPYRNTSVSEQTQDAYIAELNDKLASGEISEREYDRAFNDYYQGGESEAAELRRTHTVRNETTQQGTNGQQTATQGAREQEAKKNETGESVLHESGKRTGRADTGVAAGIVEESAGRNQSREESTRAIREKVDLENQLRDRKIGKVSTRAAGVPGGTQNEIITVVPNDIRTETMQEAERFLKAEGFEKVKFVLGAMEIRDGRSGKVVKAEGFIDGANVWIRADSKLYTMHQLAAHESFHMASQTDPNLRSRLANRIMDEYGTDFDAMIAKYIEAYQGCYGLEDPDAWDYIEEILADAYAGMNRKNLGADKYKKIVNEEVNQNKSQRETGAERKTGPPKKYSIDKDYQSEIDRWEKDGKPEGENFVLGQTGDVLQGLGAMEQSIYLRSEKINAILHDHPEMTVEEIKRIPEILDDPVLVMKSRNKARSQYGNSRLVMFGSVKAKDGRPIMCVMDLRPTENGFLLDDMQKVTSAYTKDNDPVWYVENSDILHLDKKRTIPLLRGMGFQMPMSLLQSGSVGSISYEGKRVKLQGVPFAEVVKENVDGTKGKFSVADTELADSQEANENRKTALDFFGKTYRWSETGYLLRNGTKLDFSGRHEGGSGGYRSVDHRDISDAFEGEYGDGSYSGGMVQFMREGNIRISPESGGINLQVMPSKAQESALDDFISRERGEVTLDIDNENGETVASVEYPRGTRGSKVLNDIRNYFENGTIPQVSETQRFRYSVEETKNAWNTDKEQQDIDAFMKVNPDWAQTLAEIKEYADGKAEQQGNGVTDAQLEAMPKKGMDALRRARNSFTYKVSSALQVPVSANRNFLRSAVNAMMDEYMKTGQISQETKNVLFAAAYEKGVVIDDEFYNQYKDVKKKLKDTAVTISETDKADIADFALFKKQTSRTLNIKDSGGLPVDVFYQEMRETAPELFPEGIAHPADQLQKMYEVARSIEVSKRCLDEYYGAEKETFKAWARGDFEQAAAEMESQLAKVRRFAEDQTERAEPEPEITTVEQANEAYQELKRARREYEKANAKNLLTKADKLLVDKLVRGEMQIEDVADAQMSREITEVYEAAKDYRAAQKRIEQYKKAKRSDLMEKAKRDVGNAALWKDKKGWKYMRETQERNIRDIAPDAETAERIIRNYIRPVHQNNAEATRMKNEYRERVKKLNVSRVIEKGNIISEAAAVQMIGEAEDNIRVLEKDNRFDAKRDGKTLQEWRAVVQKVWQENPNLDKEKINKAIRDFRTIYDELFQKMNEVRVRNGYEPVNYRQGYFPHFQPGQTDGIISLFAKAMGIDAEVTALPTSINGLTHTFRPGIQWFGPALERIGYNTAYDAVEGFDRYIEGVSDVVWHTDDIQRLRALERAIRYLSTDEGIREQIDAVERNDALTMEQKEAETKRIFENAKFALGNFAVDLSEYTNLLANKKHSMDRRLERLIGREWYNLAKGLENRVAANMVAINPASWLTNFIPLTQAGMEIDTKSMLEGMWQTLKAYKTDDGFVDRSTFLTNRRGSDPLVKTWGQRTSQTLSKPMEYIDTFTADAIVRARYLQNVKRGMSEEMELSEADEFAAGVMADRSKGSMPTIFEARNPVIKLFTQFQLEVNNQLSWLFKDVPREMKDRGLKVIAAAIIKYVLGAFLYNEVYEYFIGRRPALDPIGILNDTVGDFTGYELPNLVAFARGEDRDFRTEKKSALTAMKNVVDNFTDNIPGFDTLSGLVGMEGGRVPFSSSLPDVKEAGKALLDDDMSWEKRAKILLDEAAKPLAHWILPFGGGQIKKLAYGIEAVARGGSYTVDSEGNDILQYPVFNETTGQKVGGTAKAVFFGKSALKGAQEWVESGFKSLSAKQTSAYKAMIAAGEGQMESWDVIDTIRKTKKTEDKSQEANQKQALAEADISDAAKVACYYALFADEEEQEKIEKFVQEGLNIDAYLQYQSATAGIKADRDSKGESIDGTKKRKVLEAINALDVSDEQKDFLVEAAGYKPTVLTPWKYMDYAKFEQAVRTGKGMRDMVKEALNAGAEPGDITEIVTMLFKDEYINANAAERADLKARIITVAEVMGGTSARNSRAKAVDKWLEKDED